ncbi:uncharacterized protein [Ranitomeya imitator]|uniref:uncharacterized protein n=1 Tax=Ranitomeya imitator TaxID=111125 RepID=UPI0037E76E9B
MMERRSGIRCSALQLRKKWANLRYKKPQQLAELRAETRRERRQRAPPAPATGSSATSSRPQPRMSQRLRREQPPAIASSASSDNSGSPHPGTSHAVIRARSISTPPQATTPPFRHPSSSLGSVAFSPEASIPAAAVARARGWVVSSSYSGDDQQASLLQSPTLRELLAQQRRMERTAALLLEQVKQQGRTLRHLLAHRRGRN